MLQGLLKKQSKEEKYGEERRDCNLHFNYSIYIAVIVYKVWILSEAEPFFKSNSSLVITIIIHNLKHVELVVSLIALDIYKL